MLFSSTALAAVGLLATAASANSHHMNRMDIHHKRAATAAASGQENATAELAPRGPGGEFSWFETGLGACGNFNNAGDYIVAIPASLWDSAPFRSFCGQQITITVNGRRATATVADRCPGCHPNKLDLTTGLFSYLSNFGNIVQIGILQGDWEFGNAGEEEERKKKEEEERRRRQEEEERRQREEEERRQREEEEEKERKRKEQEEQEAARSRSSASATRTSAPSSPPTSTNDPSSTSSTNEAAATTTPGAANVNPENITGVINQAQAFLAQAGSLAVNAYHA